MNPYMTRVINNFISILMCLFKHPLLSTKIPIAMPLELLSKVLYQIENIAIFYSKSNLRRSLRFVPFVLFLITLSFAKKLESKKSYCSVSLRITKQLSKPP